MQAENSRLKAELAFRKARSEEMHEKYMSTRRTVDNMKRYVIDREKQVSFLQKLVEEQSRKVTRFENKFNTSIATKHRSLTDTVDTLRREIEEKKASMLKLEKEHKSFHVRLSMKDEEEEEEDTDAKDDEKNDDVDDDKEEAAPASGANDGDKTTMMPSTTHDDVINTTNENAVVTAVAEAADHVKEDEQHHHVDEEKMDTMPVTKEEGEDRIVSEKKASDCDENMSDVNGIIADATTGAASSRE